MKKESEVYIEDGCYKIPHKDYYSLDDLYSDYSLTLHEVIIILSALSDRRDTLTRKLDGVRKMQGSIDDEMYDYLIDEYHSEMDTIRSISMTLK